MDNAFVYGVSTASMEYAVNVHWDIRIMQHCPDVSQFQFVLQMNVY